MRILNTLVVFLFSICMLNAQTVWTGAVDTDWNNSDNWNAGVPTSGMLATISGGATSQPTYAGSTVLDFTIQNAGTLTFNTIVYNVGTIINFGGATIVNDNQIINAGSITFDNDGILNNNGTFDNYGAYDHAASAILNNASGATFNSYGSFNSNGQINNDGLLNIEGTFSNSNGMTNNGTFAISGMASFPFASNLDNNSGASIDVQSGGMLDVNGSLNNDGSITVDGMLAIQSASVLTNDGTITNNNELDLGGMVANNSTLTNNGLLNISSSGVLDNNSNVNNNATITLEICGKLIQNAGNNIGGTIENEGLVYEINGTVDEVNGEFGETFTDINSTPAPIPACKGDIVLTLDANGVVNFTGEDIDLGRSYGSCGATLVTYDATPNQFTTADIGVQIVTLTITDNFGVSSSCDDFVAVVPMPTPINPIDDPDITFSCPNNITLGTEPGAQFAEANWTEPTAETTCVAGSSVIINAKGDEGQENMELWVNCVLVDSWTVGTSYQNYTYNTTDVVTADQVLVKFTNDFYDPNAGIDNNLSVNNVTVDGVVYETEDASVLGYGVTGVGCQNLGFHSADKLSCNGFFQYGGGTPGCSNYSNIDGFTYLGDYNGSKYYCSETNFNWNAAQALVASHGGHLVTVNDAGENQFLQNNLVASVSWIGYNDIASEGNFVWSNGETPGYTNWDAGEPNNYNNSDGAVMLQSTGLWRDREISDSYEVMMEIPCCAESIACSGVADNISGFTLLGEYDDSKYYVSNAAATWTAANVAASNNGGHLAGISSQAENDFIQNSINPASGSVWTGFNTVYSQGVFNWVSGEPVGYTNWQSGEPNGDGIDYAARMKKSSGEWTDQPINVSFEYVMEIPCSSGNGGGGGGGSPELTVTQISGPLSGSNFPAGTTEVAYEVTDNCGNLEVCIFEVTIDPTPAIFNMTGCPADIVLDAAPGANSAVASWIDPTGTSDCFRVGPIGVDQTFGLESGDAFPIGTSNIGYAVFDSCGNFQSCLFNVTINFVPATLTVASCSEDVSAVSEIGTGGAVVTWDAPTGTSDCYLGSTASVIQISGPASGSFIPNGVTQIIYLLTDDCVNTELCIFNVVVTEETDPCAGSGGDADGDGTCADVDCDDNDASVPAAPGTTCDDGNPDTENDVILADGCTCEGTTIDPCANNGGDVDGDGTCADVDCDDNDASIPAAPGTTCDDGNPNTENDVILADGCTCEGTTIAPCALNGGDADEDGVCADVDCDDNDASVPAAPGSSCDDGNPDTENDEIGEDGCTCTGTPIQTGCNPMYTISGNDLTITGLNGAHNSVKIFDTENGWSTIFSCLDDCGNPAVINLPEGSYYLNVTIYNDSWQTECGLQEGFEITGGCSVGASCDDGDPCTDNDAYDVDCNCVGTYSGDVDGDGTCTNEDCDDNDASVPAAPGSTCDDGNPDTENDVIGSDGCSCAGTPIGACDNNGGDVDGDGICADVDCDDNDASVPAAPGTTCDDGNPDTENDVILADGCTCEGTPINTGCDPMYTVSGNDVTVTGLNGAHNSINIFDTGNGWQTVYSCFDNCINVITLPDGDYYIHIKVMNDSYQIECQIQEYFTVDGGGPACTPGTACNDNDACTNNDTYDSDCNCIGTYSGDNDNDGVCTNEDCDDNDASIPTSPGTTCDDGDPNTTNDVILADGCTCAGTIPGACDINITTGPGSITIDGLTGANVLVNVFNSSWVKVFECVNNTCDLPVQVIEELSNGTYYVKAANYDASWTKSCEAAEYVTVTGGQGLEVQNDLEYLFFQAVKDGREVSLNWTTNTEFKNASFVIEHSTDGDTFTELDEVASFSESYEPIHYQERDAAPVNGVNFYRVKEIFIDGSYRYSAMDAVFFNLAVNEFAIFPNPTANQIFVNLKEYAGQSATIQILNNLGQIMHQVEINELSEEPVGIDVSGYPGGVYGMSVKIENRKRMTNLFVVVKK